MKKLILILLVLFVISVGLATAGLVGVYYWASSDLPSFRKLTDYRPALVTTVYARDNRILGYFYTEKRFLVTLSDMPKFLSQAFLAAEDSGFYQHEGVDLTAIARAMTKNIQHGTIRQGGSTITQQIIKRLLLTPEKSFSRKIKEAILAYRLERYLTKDEILTIYLNQIFLGAHSYGVEAAARTYFGVHVGQLTLAQAAILAGLPQAPTRYSPLHDFDEAKRRQKYVLGRMLELSWITQEEHDKAVSEPLIFKSMDDPSWGVGAFYLEEIRRQLIEKYGEEAVYTGGLQVYAAIDLFHQQMAEKALRKALTDLCKRRGYRGPLERIEPAKYNEYAAALEVKDEVLQSGAWFKALVSESSPKGLSVRFGKRTGFIEAKSMAWARNKTPKAGDVIWASLVIGKQPQQAAKQASEAQERAKAPAKAEVAQPGKAALELALEQEPDAEGALVSLDPRNGDVMASVGGYSFERSQFNRATQSLRQPGSSFKPIVYSAAMDNGLTPGSVVMDSPFVYEDPWTHKVWKPENYEGGFLGPMTLRTALAKSRNLVTIRVAQQIGIQNVVKRAKELGLEPNFPPVLAISLGAVAVNITNMCQAYTAFARDGSYVKPRYVLEIKNAWGEEVFRAKVEEVPAISPQTAYIMACMLKEVVRAGTAGKAMALGRPVAGKTGTTNDENDAWFIGFSPYLLTGVYVGFDQVQPLGKGEAGGKTALPAWLDYRMAVENQYPVEDFHIPPGVTMVPMDPNTGLRADGSGVVMPFKTGSEPTYYTVIGGEDGVVQPGSNANAPLATGEDLLKQLY